MSGARIVGRSDELATVGEFLTAMSERPSGLVIDGEMGIGKTTLWSATVQLAQSRQFRVLSTRATQAGSVTAYAVIADLIGTLDSREVDALPEVQRLAIERVRLRTDRGGSPRDQRIVATTLLSILERLAATSPVLVAIDDVQWLDAPSKGVFAFVTRRLHQRIGVLFAEGSAPGDSETTASWFRLARQDGIERIQLGPLRLGGLHTLIAERLGRSLPRPTTVGIAETSHGNPQYALELARLANDQSLTAEPILPAPLAELVRDRMGHLRGDVCDVLLAAACISNPTVDLLARATGDSAERTVELLEPIEDKGIIEIQGNRVRFSDPLLARGVYADASPIRRRKMHRRLADLESRPDLHARHLALATSSSDPSTLQVVDAAADAACTCGTPAAAAELLDLALQIGGDTPLRRIRSATCHFEAGNVATARTMVKPLIARLPPGALRAAAANLLAEICMYDDSFADATELLQSAENDGASGPPVLLQTLLLRSFALLSTGEYADSLHYAMQAVTLAEDIDAPALVSQALANQVHVGLVCGRGVDESSLRGALGLENPDIDVALTFSASAVNALVLAWTGRLDDARLQMQIVRNRCIERNAHSHIMFVDLHSTLIDVWRADFVAATSTAEDAMERAELLGGDHMAAIAHTARAVVGAYAGREREARDAARAAIGGANRCGSIRLADLPVMALGFLDVSLMNYPEALARLQPLIVRLDTVPGTEIFTAAFIPDAVEAMIAVGQVAEAEPLIDALESNGRHLDRPWMLAVGARCRSMWLAARDEVEAATSMAQHAMTEHDRLPMPFEHARTRLLLGVLQRRQHLEAEATTNLSAALSAFEQLGAPLWASRTRDELGPAYGRHVPLTSAEQAIAELAASGMSNRDVAATLGISLKTVEAGLTRAYRKLGIRSRAQLGKRMADLLDEPPSDAAS